MNLSHVSAHARVFEGVRTARIRAFQDNLREVPDRQENCFFHPDEPAVALWVHADTGAVSPVCQHHLYKSLKQHDAEPDSAPPALVPLKGRRRA